LSHVHPEEGAPLNIVALPDPKCKDRHRGHGNLGEDNCQERQQQHGHTLAIMPRQHERRISSEPTVMLQLMKFRMPPGAVTPSCFNCRILLPKHLEYTSTPTHGNCQGSLDYSDWSFRGGRWCFTFSYPTWCASSSSSRCLKAFEQAFSAYSRYRPAHETTALVQKQPQ
jgi:hypothetical protein